ncbi:MAG: hypothetical protein ACRDYX_17950 [Egibacteraceae bacterium]
MNLEQLLVVCQEAARDLVARSPRPVPATVILPLPGATRVTTLPDFPDDDSGRLDLLARFAADVMRPANAPCYGFLAEATLMVVGEPADVLVCAYGARRRGACVTAAPLTPEGLGEFIRPEPLDEAALPYLRPLQRAVDAAVPG